MGVLRPADSFFWDIRSVQKILKGEELYETDLQR